MPSRRRKALTNKMTAQAAPEAEEARIPVTQVVEVVEEEEEKMPEAAEPVQDPPAEEPPVSEPQEEAHRVDSTRKSMVEELYTPEKKSSVMPEISVHKNKPIASLFMWAIVTILVAILTGGILFALAKKTSPIKLFARPTPTPTASPTPTPTPAPATIDKTSFEIQVLNGGGTPGAAGKMKTFLEDKGYTVASTGNTAEYTYTTTEIHGKTTMKDAIANLQADLTSTYTLGTVAADLSASASADVQVIVGK
ncbi:MAG: LytR C-terminal domain-containing protein [Candidatus Gottesmanbacteria bacterium]|nr:LytR C-terminal domain-containing protein [Candidatus Gottesmanbacteria bacterium]